MLTSCPAEAVQNEFLRVVASRLSQILDGSAHRLVGHFDEAE